MSKVTKRKPYYRKVTGIDPGISGALATVYQDENGFFELDSAMPMPIIQVKGGKTVDGGAIIREFNDTGAVECVIELVNSFPGQGVASSFQFGRMLGAVEGAVRTTLFPHYVQPAQWKKDLKLTKDKKETMAAARAIFGDETADAYWPKVKDDGIAEAALLAVWFIEQENNK